MTLALINTVLNAGVSFIKLAEVAETFYDTYNSIGHKDLTTKEKIARCSTNISFCVAQAADLYASKDTSSSNNELKHNLRTAAEFLSFAKQGVRVYTNRQQNSKEDLLFVALFFLHRIDGIDATTILAPAEWDANQLADVKAILPWTKFAASLLVPAVSLYSGEPPSTLEPSAAGLAEARVPEIIALDEEFLKLMDIVRNAKDISEFSKIPGLFVHNGVLQSFICRITKQPIRYVVVVTKTAYDRNPVYYERDVLDQYFESETIPPDWPSDLNFDRTLIAPCQFAQKLIDNTLREMKKEIDSLPLETL